MSRRPLAADTSTIRGRITWYLGRLWHGSQVQMARELGMSPGGLSNVLAGKRAAGKNLLTALVGHPLVDPAWLMTGEGSPIASDPTGIPSSDLTLPVAKSPLTGMIKDCLHLLHGEQYPVSRFDHRSSRYWLSVGTDSPLLAQAELKICQGDLVLIESDPAYWTDRLAMLVGRPCTVLRKDTGTYQVALLVQPADAQEKRVDRWIRLLERPKADVVSTQEGRPPRNLSFDVAMSSEGDVPEGPGSAGQDNLAIVGVAIRLTRMY